MKSRRSITAIALGLFIFIASVGFITGCGDTERDPNSDADDMSEGAPESQPERAYNEDFDTAKGQEQTFEASLKGANEVPEKVTTEASGNATVTLRGDSIHIEGEFSDLGSEYAASHIHLGAEDENGDPIQTLEPDVGDDKTSGSWEASYRLDQAHLSALAADSLYINVHTAENKAGEIRGQLTSSGME